MVKYLFIPTVIIAAAGAQVLMKYAINLILVEKLPLITLFSGWHIYLSIGLYLIAFVATIYLFSVFELSFISPILVGGVMLLIFLAGFMWGESINIFRIAGGLCLIAGTALLAYSH